MTKNIAPVFLALLVAYASPCVAQVNVDLNPGSASAPSLYFGADTGTGLWQASSGSHTLNFSTNGAEVAAFDQYGNFDLYKSATGYQIDAITVLMFPDTDTTSIAVGDGALAAQSVTTGSDNTAVGSSALNSVTNGAENTAVGYWSQNLNTTGSYNTSVGVDALWSNTSGSNNTVVGASASNNNTSGYGYNTVVGAGALYAGTDASESTAVGYNALEAANSDGPNDAFGEYAGYNITAGSSNVAIGANAMASGGALEGDENIGIGDYALFSIGGGSSNNTVMGYEAGYYVGGSDNTLIGHESGYGVTGNSNIILGEDPDEAITTGSSNILIGNSLTGVTNSSSNQLDIGDVITGGVGSTGYISVPTLQLNGIESPMTPGGRLTFVSGTPVMTTDETAQTAIYYDAYVNGLVPVYNGTHWLEESIGSGLTLTLNTTYMPTTKVFDVYASEQSGTLTLCAMYWGSNSSRSTTAGGYGGNANASIAMVNGIWTNNAAIGSSECYNNSTSYAISKNQGTYLGSFYTTANGKSTMNFSQYSTNGGAANIEGLFNAYNRVRYQSLNAHNSSSWTTSTTSWGNLNGSASDRISWVDGLQQVYPVFRLITQTQVSSTPYACYTAVGLDSTVTGATVNTKIVSTSATAQQVNQNYGPQLGFHYGQAAQAASSTSATCTYYGSGPESLVLEAEY